MFSCSDGTLLRMVAAFALIVIIGSLQLGTAQTGQAAPVEAYVQENVDIGLKILQDKSRSETDRHAKLREFLVGLLDLKRIALFTLGSWRRNTAQPDVDDF